MDSNIRMRLVVICIVVITCGSVIGSADRTNTYQCRGNMSVIMFSTAKTGVSQIVRRKEYVFLYSYSNRSWHSKVYEVVTNRIDKSICWQAGSVGNEEIYYSTYYASNNVIDKKTGKLVNLGARAITRIEYSINPYGYEEIVTPILWLVFECTQNAKVIMHQRIRPFFDRTASVNYDDSITYPLKWNYSDSISNMPYNMVIMNEGLTYTRNYKNTKTITNILPGEYSKGYEQLKMEVIEVGKYDGKTIPKKYLIVQYGHSGGGQLYTQMTATCNVYDWSKTCERKSFLPDIHTNNVVIDHRLKYHEGGKKTVTYSMRGRSSWTTLIEVKDIHMRQNEARELVEKRKLARISEAGKVKNLTICTLVILVFAPVYVHISTVILKKRNNK